MDVTAAQLLVIPLLMLVVVLVGALQLRAMKNLARMKEHAASRGWTWVPPSGRIRLAIEGQHDGLPWRLEVRTSRNAQNRSSSSVRFEAPAETPAVVMLGPKVPDLLKSVPLSDAKVQMMLRLLVGDDAHLLADASFMALEGVLGEQMDVLTTDEAVARQLLDAKVREALLEWIGSGDQAPVITWWRGQLVVRPRWTPSRPEQLDKLVELGCRLLTPGGMSPAPRSPSNVARQPPRQAAPQAG